MDLYNSISRRKSCRKFDMKPLSDDLLKEVDSVINQFMKLDENFNFTHRFTTKVAGSFAIDAPHYLIITGEGKPNELENVGFLFEQLILWFDAHDIGSIWLGYAKDLEVRNKNDIITIGFGYGSEPIHREESEFKRKPIREVTNAIDDVCIKASYLAPSGMNLQPWYFDKQEDRILVYKKKPNVVLKIAYNLTDLDMGISLCHYAIAAKHYNRKFKFNHNKNFSKSDYQLFGEIVI